jgi:ATPase family associated with various cellular activities (AAA)
MATKGKDTNSLTEQRSVTLDAAKREIKVAMRKKRPIFLWGPPGIGKSELIADICEEMGGKLYDLRLALMDPSDLKGVLYYNTELHNATWSAPPDLPSKETAAKYPVVVLFLDEMNSAPPATQAAAYQLVLNRRVGTYELPDNVVVVAAGNRDTDRGVTYRMPAPLANRFIHLTLRPDFETWQTWAILNQVHPDVVGYITANKVDLFNFDPKTSSQSFATPRSWSFVSELLREETLNEIELTDLVSGTVGEGVALKFNAHRKVSANMPNPTHILEGRVKELKNKDIGACYSLTVALCYELKEAWDKYGTKDEKGNDRFHAEMDNVFRFIMDNLNVELQVMLVHAALTTYQLKFKSSKMKNFKEFNQNAGKHVLSAIQS